MKGNGGTWTAFLAMAFVVVGLTGLFASFAAPLPLQRAMARDAALDEALASGGQAGTLDALRTRLDDSAAEVIDGAGPLEARVATARAAMRASLLHEADAVGDRLRLMVIIVTIVAAVFGAIVVGASAAKAAPLETSAAKAAPLETSAAKAAPLAPVATSPAKAAPCDRTG